MLISWKSIAAYFDCDERTAKRWELERGLPVHRAPGEKRSRVFAYVSELESWLQSNTLERHPQFEASTDKRHPEDIGAQLVPVESSDANGTALAPPAAAASQDKFPISRRWPLWVAISTFTLAAITTAQVMQLSRFINQPDSRNVHVSANTLRHAPAGGAEELYLRGRYYWNLRTADGLAEALRAYTQATLKDPDYAEAYAGLAETYDLLPQFGGADVGKSLTNAKAAAEHALALNPDLASAHTAKAFALFYWDWDIEGSDSEFKRALELDPDSPHTHHWYASSLADRLEGSDCLQQIDDALRLNPTSAAIAADAAFFHANFGDFDAGMKKLKEIERTQPTLATPTYFFREVDFAQGDYPGYIAETRRYALITQAPDDVAMADAVDHGWAQANSRGLLEARVRILKASFDRGEESGFWLGEALLLLGRQKEALPYFNASLNRHFILLITMQECPWAAKLSKDPGYAALFTQIHERMRHGYPAHPAVVPIKLCLPR
jgi:hypothetical protein